MPLSDFYPELKGWTPVAPAPNPPAPTQIPDENTTINPRLRTSVPLPFQYQPDTLRQYIRPGISSFRVFPQAPSASPAVNAAATTQAKVVVATAPSTSTGGLSSVGLTMPPQYTVSNSPLTANGNIGVAWAVEAPGTVLETPPPGLGSYQGNQQATGHGGQTVTVTNTPTTSTSLGVYFQYGNASPFNTPSGWTSINSAFLQYKAISGTSPISLSQTLTSASNTYLAESFCLFSGPAPVLVQSKVTSALAIGTMAFTTNNTAGNTLMIATQFSGSAAAGCAVSDSNNNQYSLLMNQQFTGATGPTIIQNNLYAVANCAAGANTVSWTINGGVTTSVTVTIMEFGPLVAGSSIPSFGNLTGAQIPPISLNGGGNGGIVGILQVGNGGTGVTLSTGSGTRFVLQNSPSISSPTISTPAFTGNVQFQSGIVSNYNGILTVGSGIPSEIANVNSTTRTANVALTTLYSVVNAGMFRLNGYLIVNRVATTSSTLPDLNIQWTDQDNSTVQSLTFVASAPTGNSLTTMFQCVAFLSVKASTNIQYQTGDSTAYASVGATTMQYSVRLILEIL